MAATVQFDIAGPYEVEEVDVPFARPQGQELLARIYRPQGTPVEPLVALVDVHGGAWARLDRTVGAPHGRSLTACGLVVVALDFRQGPAHQHPSASADVAAGVRYVRAHARHLGVDPLRIGLLGSSSGGQLALLVAVRPGVPEHAGTPIVLPDGSLDNTPGDDSVAFVMALYPVVDPLARYRYALGRKDETPTPGGFNAAGLIAGHRGYFASEAAMADASVTRIVDAGEARALPPVWIVPSPMRTTTCLQPSPRRSCAPMRRRVAASSVCTSRAPPTASSSVPAPTRISASRSCASLSENARARSRGAPAEPGRSERRRVRGQYQAHVTSAGTSSPARARSSSS